MRNARHSIPSDLDSISNGTIAGGDTGRRGKVNETHSGIRNTERPISRLIRPPHPVIVDSVDDGRNVVVGTATYRCDLCGRIDRVGIAAPNLKRDVIAGRPSDLDFVGKRTVAGGNIQRLTRYVHCRSRVGYAKDARSVGIVRLYPVVVGNASRYRRIKILADSNVSADHGCRCRVFGRIAPELVACGCQRWRPSDLYMV